MAATIGRPWADGCQGNPGSRRLRAQLDPTLNVMSSHSLDFDAAECTWRHAVIGRRDSGVTDFPSGRRFAGPMLLVVVSWRWPGRRRAGRPDVVVADVSVGAIAPSLLPI